ncbi:hypothetical protein [Nocardioides sp.]|uniref:hypothetical protein n=1 Tax=Nocardioides sp. TaxID=35761 RepID=UPI00261CFDF3|nr:hypothetical protein [Nocardioides sp.]
MLTLPTTAASAAPVLDVPDAPSGVIGVTAHLAPQDAPYVAVAINHSTVFASATAAVTPLVPTDVGGSTPITVETWGLTGSSAFTLMGCAADDPSTCLPIGDPVTRDVRQPAQPKIVYSAEGVIFTPEETVTVTIPTTIGGVRRAFLTAQGATSSVTFDASAPYSFNLSQVSGSARLDIDVCSTYNTTLCTVLSGRTVTVSPAPAPWSVSRTDGDHPLSTVRGNPGAALHLASVNAGSTATSPLVQWSLDNASGHTVIAPVTATTAIQPSGVIAFTAIPANAATSVLPDGLYTLRTTVTYSNGRITRTAASTLPVTLLAKPSAPPAPKVVNAKNDVHIDAYTETSPDQAHWTVTPHPLESQVLTLTITNTAGTAVHRETFGCASCGAATYAMTWDGTVDGTRTQRPGIYVATVTSVDTYGRLQSVSLGRVRVLAQHVETKRVVIRADRAMIASGHFVGRCSSIRTSAAGTRQARVVLTSNSRCASRRGRADEAVQRFSVPTPSVPADASVYQVSSRIVARSARPHRSATAWRRIALPSRNTGWSPPSKTSVPSSEPLWWADSRATDPTLHPLRQWRSGSPLLLELAVHNGNWVGIHAIEVTIRSWRWTTDAATARPAVPMV